MAQIENAIATKGNVCFCRACGAEQDGCEPDARRYRCETCGQLQVYGGDNLTLRPAAFEPQSEAPEKERCRLS